MINVYKLYRNALNKVCQLLVPLDMKCCICHFVKWRIHPLISKGIYYADRLLLCTLSEHLVCADYNTILGITKCNYAARVWHPHSRNWVSLSGKCNRKYNLLLLQSPYFVYFRFITLKRYVLLFFLECGSHGQSNGNSRSADIMESSASYKRLF